MILLIKQKCVKKKKNNSYRHKVITNNVYTKYNAYCITITINKQ